MKIAILDDYQNVASSLADWDSLAAEVVVFTKAFADGDEAVRALAGFDVLVAMRERTRFPAEVLERLTGLRFLVSTGPANAAIDVAAALDIFDTEPLPADHQLRSLPNALLTGHVAYVTRDFVHDLYQDAVEDIAAYQAGSPIRLME